MASNMALTVEKRHVLAIASSLVAALAGACGAAATAPASSAPAAAAPRPPAAPAPAPTPVAARPDPTPPKLRLPGDVRPLRNQVELTIDPARSDFEGRISIDVDIVQATDTIWLDADGIEVLHAELEQGQRHQPLVAWTAPRSFLALRAQAPLPTGRARIVVDYRGQMSRTENGGVFVNEEAGELYQLTHFEPLDARRAFPCFDEPSFKVPWQITMRVPARLEALTNTAAIETRREGEWKIVRFAESKPLPSYLIAFATGPWEYVAAGATRTQVPVRIVVPKGRSKDAAFSAAHSAEILGLLEDYFGTPYPYDKLDQIVVPRGGGAMEHPGLVTYGAPLLLIPDDEMTRARQMAFASVVAHELAHQWFGDIVTCAFWDDIWLNEAFASWMQTKIMARFRPAWPVEQIVVGGRDNALRLDSQGTARKIHQPIESNDDIANSFDGITYTKGAAVLTALERWMGEEAFQKGVQLYIARHMWKNATYADFVGALGEGAGRDLHGPFDALVDQAGAPLVDVELKCTPGAAPALALRQSRYSPLGSQTPRDGRWQVPVCVRWGKGKQTGRACTLLDQAAMTWTLPTPTCPDWLLPNAGGVGYYRSVAHGDLLARLDRHAAELTTFERLTLLSDVEAQLELGSMELSDALALVTRLAREKDPHLVKRAIGMVSGIEPMVPERLRPNYQRFVRKVFGARARALGLAARKGEDDDSKALRAQLVALVGGPGADPVLVREATRLAHTWIATQKGVDPEMVDAVLGVAARGGDAALWEEARAAAVATKERRLRNRFIATMASVRDPELVKRNLAIVLTDAFEPRDAYTLLWSARGERALAPVTYQFFKDHWDELIARLPRDYGAFFPRIAPILCSSGARAEVESWFRGRSTKYLGGPRVLDASLESMDMCIAYEARHGAGLATFLSRQ